MLDFLMQHQVVLGATSAMIVSAAARALPVPDPTSGKFYRWFYTFAGFLLANFDKTK